MHRTPPHPTTKDCSASNVINDEVGKLRFKQREEKDIPEKFSYLFSQIPSSGWLGLNINFLIPEAEEQEAHISLILYHFHAPFTFPSPCLGYQTAALKAGSQASFLYLFSGTHIPLWDLGVG